MSKKKENDQVNNLLDVIQNITRTGVWEWTVATDKYSCSKEFTNILEIDLAAIENFTSLINLFEKSEQKKIRDALDSVIETGKSFNIEVVYHTKNNNSIWIRFIGHPEKYQDEVVKIYGVIQDITYHKYAETVISDNKVKYPALTNQLPIGVYRTTVDGKILYANKALIDILGYNDLTELEGVSVYETFVNKDIRDKTNKQLLESSTVISVEHCLKKKNGEFIWVRDTGQIVRDEKGQAVYFDGIIEDISKYKETQTALDSSEEKYKSLTRQLPLGVYRTSRKGKFLFVNPALVNILGYDSAEELLSVNVTEVFNNPDDRNMQLKKWKLSSDIQSDELRFKRKDGKVIWVRDTGKAFINEDGEIDYFDGVIEDITTIKAAQDALLESEKTTRAILNASVDSIVLLNRKGIVLDCNETIVDNVNGDMNQVIGSYYFSLYDFETSKTRKAYVNNVFDNKEEEHFEDKVGSKSYENHVFPIFDDKDKVTKAVLFSKDITQQKNNELEIIRAKEKAEEADELKSAFLANMSHEIRTPMNSIIGFSKLVDNPRLSEEKRKQFTKIIRERTKDLLQIIDEILDISKIESGQMPITESVFSLNHILDEMYNFFYSRIKEESKKELNLYIKRNFRTSQGNIITDGVKVKEILINLIDNAIKFTNQGDIMVGCSIEKDVIQFFVKDTGIGISKDKMDVIFERFRQSEEFSTRKYGGPGLGLAIAKGLTDLLNGKIWAESILGVGSTFYFTIPYKQNASVPNGEDDIESDEQCEWSDNVILIVEDDNISQEYLAEVVSETGVQLLFAENGFDAIQLVKDKPIDLILMDIQLPDMDGYETTRKIKAINKNIPVLAQTAFAMEQDRIKCFDAGCDDFITKPIDPDALLAAISRHLKKI